MNCVTMVPKDLTVERDKDRRTSRGLTACLRGEKDEYNYKAEGK